jgi:hypothetical protein
MLLFVTLFTEIFFDFRSLYTYTFIYISTFVIQSQYLGFPTYTIQTSVILTLFLYVVGIAVKLSFQCMYE